MSVRVEASTPEAGGADRDDPPVLALEGIEKRFGPVRALTRIDLSIRRGTVHALVGENGAGKSTLIKILTGAHIRSAGQIRIDNEAVALATPTEALARGIFAVQQEMVLCPHLTVAQNLFLGAERTHRGMLQDRAMRRAAQRLVDDLGFDLPVAARLGDLSMGQQQLVSCARAALFGARLIIFDEPTAYLSRAETDCLFAFIRRLRAEGRTVIYISHRMEEIFELADAVTVLRDGSVVSSRPIAEATPDQLVRDMAARDVGTVHHKADITLGEPLLEVEGLTGPGFHDVSLTLRAGEIVGIFGLVGSGRSEFARCVFCRTQATAGRIHVAGRERRFASERDAIDAGIALIPESRRDEGLCLDLDIRRNISLASLSRFTRRGLIDGRTERSDVKRQMQALRVVAAGPGTKVSTLSGGNQQKIVICKWLMRGARIFLFDEPTAGVDVATKVEIYRIIADLLRDGAGVIVISSYLPEAYDLADTLYVFREGTSVARFDKGQSDPEQVLAAAVGAKRTAS